MRNAEDGTENTDSPAQVRLTIASFVDEMAPLLAGEVRVWVIPLDAPPLIGAEDFFAHLTPEEQTRAERYKVAKARHQFVTGRALLRWLLGRHLAMRPNEVAITYTGAGKPVLADTASRLQFNVTHTDGLALIAFADHAIGIDVERVRPIADPAGLVGRFFSPAERDAYLSLPPELQPAGFWRGWTCKEAVIKAAGLSVSCLDEFDVELHPERLASLLAARHPALCERSLSLAAWEPEAGFAAAVAVETSGLLPNQNTH